MQNQICYFEIGCWDRAKAGEFYSKMFGWTLEADPNATRLRTGGDIGGHLTSLGQEPYNYTIFDIMVDDVAAALEKATAFYAEAKK